MGASFLSFLRGLFPGRPIVVVSGLPRSGTSMVMQMLKEGGLEIGTDNIRSRDDDNPRGYLELERVKELDRPGDTSWLGSYRGRGIKVISFLLRFLPGPYRYRIIFIRRDLDEVLLSQRKMLQRRGEDGGTEDDARLRENFARHLDQVGSLLRVRKNFEALYVDYRSVLSDPAAEAARINDFLGRRLDQGAMAAAVDGSLYRNRKKE